MLKKLRDAFIFGFAFSLLSVLSFLAIMKVDIDSAPTPMGHALSDLFSFVPVIGVSAFILGLFQAFLLIALKKNHAKWIWPLSFVLAVIFGGLISLGVFSLIWIVVSLANLFLVWMWIRFNGN